MLKQTRTSLLLLANAAAIIVAGVMIAQALNPDGGTVRVVDEYSDELDEEMGLADLPETVFEELWGHGDGAEGGGGSSGSGSGSSGGGGGESAGQGGGSGVSDAVNLARGELWARTNATMYATADTDICIDVVVDNIGDLYWQSGNKAVIEGFYKTSRENLGYPSSRCRYPKIVGVGTVVVTVGSYSGVYRDEITIEVKAPPVEEWQREVLRLVNVERSKAGLGQLAWGDTCAGAASTRARELAQSYSHTRPDGSSWSTACPVPGSGGASGENVYAGNAAVSPATVVAGWMESADHRANILNPVFTKMAVGFYFDLSSNLKTHWEQFFSTY